MTTSFYVVILCDILLQTVFDLNTRITGGNFCVWYSLSRSLDHDIHCKHFYFGELIINLFIFVIPPVHGYDYHAGRISNKINLQINKGSNSNINLDIYTIHVFLGLKKQGNLDLKFIPTLELTSSQGLNFTLSITKFCLRFHLNVSQIKRNQRE